MTEPPDLRAVGATDADDPWPGLESFHEADELRFRGRETEVRELHRLVLRSRLAVLYGVSGMGKTSLLRAGLFPRLRKDHFLPIYVRLDFGTGAPRLAQQVLDAITRDAALAGAEAPRPEPNDTLWEYFHRTSAHFWSARNRRLRPFLVLDQFEEIFTLCPDPAVRDGFLAELSDLAEGRPPGSVQARVDANPEEALGYAFDRHEYNVLLSLREDYLPHLDELRDRGDLWLLDRIRLRALDGVAAREVVAQAGHLIEPDVAEQVVRVVAGVEGDAPFGHMSVEPALLSVVCRELNARRRARGEARITPDLLAVSRDDILADFYDRSFENLDPRLRDFVEENLLTVKGFRDSVALENALAEPGVTEAAIDTLVSRRLIRIDRQERRQRLELTHDILAGVVALARDRRQKAARERLALKAGVRRGVVRATALLVPIVVVLLIGWQALVVSRYRERAENAIEALDQVNATAGLSLELLDRFDNLRALDAELRDREERNANFLDFVPLLSERGTWAKVETAYMHAMDSLIMGDLLAGIRYRLGGAGVGSPGTYDDYAEVYDRLRAYLLMTMYADEINDVDRLAAQLAREATLTFGEFDEEAREILLRQFAHYASEIRRGDRVLDADLSTVDRARGFLRELQSSEAVYGLMLSTVNDDGSLQPPELGSIRLGPAVPFAFGSDGRSRFMILLDDPDLLGREDFVLGEALEPIGPEQRGMIRTLYEEDRRKTWWRALEFARLAPGNPGPNLDRFATGDLVAFLTWVGNQLTPEDLAGPFQPLTHILEFPGGRPTELAASYLLEVQNLARTFEGDAPEDVVRQSTAAVQAAVQWIEAGYPSDAVVAQTAVHLRSLLRVPLTAASGALASNAAAALRAKVGSFCSAYSAALFGTYPFDPASTRDADPSEVHDFLGPAGFLADLVENDLRGAVRRVDGRYRAVPGAPAAPTPAFLRFLDAASSFYEKTYQEGRLHIDFIARFTPNARVRSVSLQTDGQAETWRMYESPFERFRWTGGSVSLTAEGARTETQSGNGVWGLFRLLDQASRQDSGPGGSVFRWRLADADVAGEFSFADRSGIVSREDIAALSRCPG